MKKSFLLMLAASLGLAACNNFEKAPAGTLYKIHKSDGKPKIVEGDFVKLNLVQSMDDSLMFSSYENEQPVVFQVPKPQYVGDMYDMLTKFGEGDSATFKMNMDSMAVYTKQPKPPTMSKGKYLVFKLKIEKVLHKNAGEADSLYNKRAEDIFKADYDATMTRIKNGEAAKIKAYVEENKLKTTTTASGLQYVLHKAGTGPKPEMGDTVMATYIGKLTRKKADGKDNVFDTTDQAVAKDAGRWNAMAAYGPRPLVIGGIVPGMDEGLALMGVGGKVTLIIPSNLAYGEAGVRGLIPAYAPLVFDIEVFGIKKANAPSVASPPPPVEPAKK